MRWCLWCLLSPGDCKLLPLLALLINLCANITHDCIVVSTFRGFLLEGEYNDYTHVDHAPCGVERIFQNEKKIKFLLTLCRLFENDERQDTNPNKLNSNNGKTYFGLRGCCLLITNTCLMEK